LRMGQTFGAGRMAAALGTANDKAPATMPIPPMTRPENMKTWARVFGLHRNTLANHFKKQCIPNLKVGGKYQVAIHALPQGELAKHLPPAE
jgi:hypothetical protein